MDEEGKEATILCCLGGAAGAKSCWIRAMADELVLLLFWGEEASAVLFAVKSRAQLKRPLEVLTSGSNCFELKTEIKN